MKDEQQPNAQGRYNGVVAVWFTSHYPLHNRDWRNIQEFAGEYHPLAGYYDSQDPAVLHQQLHWMRRAGIDLIIYDCFSTSKETMLDELPKDTTLHLLLKELAHQQGESRKLKLCMWLERYVDNPSVEHYRFALNYIRTHMAEQDYYYRYKGRPLVVPFLNGLPDANRAIEVIEFENTYFELHRIRPFYTDVWSYIEKYPQTLRKDWMSVCPGMDPYMEMAYQAKYMEKISSPDYEKIRQDNAQYRVERENGAYYQRQLLRAKQANPDIIFVSGWNDWQYGNHIEPAVEYEFQYVDLTAKILGRWEETKPYR
ncbi:MAG: hypothetical protein NT011_11795 [Kiritimatiellaeota bacterium]|nr:hypothetical protein [Kiritimatiellota bacterium]